MGLDIMGLDILVLLMTQLLNFQRKEFLVNISAETNTPLDQCTKSKTWLSI